MEPIVSEVLSGKLKQWLGRDIYIHFEITPGGYFRNGKASLQNVHVKGLDLFRVFLELDEKKGIIQMDELTHMKIEEEVVILASYDAHDRLARTLEISLIPFPI